MKLIIDISEDDRKALEQFKFQSGVVGRAIDAITQGTPVFVEHTCYECTHCTKDLFIDNSHCDLEPEKKGVGEFNEFGSACTKFEPIKGHDNDGEE